MTKSQHAQMYMHHHVVVVGTTLGAHLTVTPHIQHDEQHAPTAPENIGSPQNCLDGHASPPASLHENLSSPCTDATRFAAALV